MDLWQNASMGLSVALQPANLVFCFIGVLAGTLVGVLPGLGPAAAISLILPTTFTLNPISGVIMLSGIYYGSMYGGSTTSILVNIPGEAASVVTCLDGYQMARQGRSGPALGISAFASFIAGTFSVLVLMVVAPPLAELALKFGAPEYFSLMFVGMTLLIFLSSGSTMKALTTAAFGLFLGLIGLDNITGTPRFTFGMTTLLDGVGLIPLVMGLFGITEVLSNLEQPMRRDIFKTEIGHLFPTLKDWKDSAWPIARGSVAGFILGILPGGGAILASFASYAIEKRISKTPEKFGSGMIAGVAGPEAANNAASGGGFIPLLCLGIPGTAVMTLLLGALMIHGVQPGPLMIKEHPDLFWSVVMSMYIGNGMLLILNLPLIGIWVRILKVPYSILFPLILLFCLIGSYTLKNNIGDVFVMITFGVIGYIMRKYEYDILPLVLAFVLGPMMEVTLRQSLLLSKGTLMIFLTRPVSVGLIVVATLLLISSIFQELQKKKNRIKKLIEKSEAA
jgi:putative tricarboxylic transport membrane protein